MWVFVWSESVNRGKAKRGHHGLSGCHHCLALICTLSQWACGRACTIWMRARRISAAENDGMIHRSAIHTESSAPRGGSPHNTRSIPTKRNLRLWPSSMVLSMQLPSMAAKMRPIRSPVPPRPVRAAVSTAEAHHLRCPTANSCGISASVWKGGANAMLRVCDPQPAGDTKPTIANSIFAANYEVGIAMRSREARD